MRVDPSILEQFRENKVKEQMSLLNLREQIKTMKSLRRDLSVSKSAVLGAVRNMDQYHTHFKEYNNDISTAIQAVGFAIEDLTRQIIRLESELN